MKSKWRVSSSCSSSSVSITISTAADFLFMLSLFHWLKFVPFLSHSVGSDHDLSDLPDLLLHLLSGEEGIYLSGMCARFFGIVCLPYWASTQRHPHYRSVSEEPWTGCVEHSLSITKQLSAKGGEVVPPDPALWFKVLQYFE